MNIDKRIIVGFVLILIVIMSMIIINKSQMSIDEYLRKDLFIEDNCKNTFNEVVYINNDIESLYIVFFIDRLAKSHCIILEDKGITYNRLYFASEIDSPNEENKGTFHLDDVLYEFQWGIMKSKNENYIDDKEIKSIEVISKTAFDVKTQDNLKISYFYKLNKKN